MFALTLSCTVWENLFLCWSLKKVKGMDETVLFIVILEVTGKERYYKLGCPKWICTRWFTFYSCVLTTFKNKNSEKNKQKLSYLKFLPKRQPCFENLKLCSFNYSSSLILEVFKMQIKKTYISKLSLSDGCPTNSENPK